MNYIKGAILTLFLLFASNVQAEPLPPLEETYFYAIVDCGNAVVFTWYTPEGGKIIPVGKIKNQEMVEEIMKARNRAEKQGNAYVIQVGEECPQI